MDWINLFWLFLILISLQPIIWQKLIQSNRQKLIAKIEGLRNSRVIVIAHRQETMSFLGFPVMRYLDIEDSEAVLSALESTPEEKSIDIVLHTPGGLAIAATQIGMAIKNRKGKVTVIIPHYAMSGGTMIAIAADEIIMSPHAVLGPLDPQVKHLPAHSILKLTQKKEINRIDDNTLILADIAEKAISQVRNQVKNLLVKRLDETKAEEVSKALTEGRWTHDFPITPELAKDLGLNVSTRMPKEFIELMSLYRQPMKKKTSVDYLPQEMEKV